MKKNLDFQGERYADIPEFIAPINENLTRLNFFMKMIDTSNKRILSDGCGTGYEIGYLAERIEFEKITAVDISKNVIDNAKSQLRHPNIEFHVMDSTNLELDGDSFDIVLSLEVLEHIRDYRKYISEIRRVLTPSGILILSTPNRLSFSGGCEKSINKFHIKEFDYQELKTLLLEYFSEVNIFGQYLKDKNKEEMRRKHLKKKLKYGWVYDWARKIKILVKIYRKTLKKRKINLIGGSSVNDYCIDKENMENSIWFITICEK